MNNNKICVQKKADKINTLGDSMNNKKSERQPQEVLEELIALASDPGWQKGLGVRLEPGQDYSYARSSLEDLIKREYLVKREGDLLDEYNESCKRNNNRNL